MVEIKIQDKTYSIPTKWEDITLKWWYGLYTIISQYNQKDEEGNPVEVEHSEVEVLKMNRDIFMYLTGIGQNMMSKLDMDSVNTAVSTVSDLLQEYKPKHIDRFVFEDETYFFPKEFLKRNTFGDYIESTQLDATIQMMKHGKFDVLPEQMAILCRTIDEEYDDDIIPSKTDKFKQLTMDIVWEFSFFLNKRTLASINVIKTFSEMAEQKASQ